MLFPTPLIKGILLKRYKRFLADVESDGKILGTHCTNTGSMKGVLYPPQTAYVLDSGNPTRKLPYTLEILEAEGTLIGVNTHRTNKLAHEFLESKDSPFGVLAQIKPEHRISDKSRADFLITTTEGVDIIIEVKNVSLKVGTTGSFPDSPTERGRKHLRELMEIVDRGERAAMVYICQRADVDSFGPSDDIDPEYGELLRQAKTKGVEIYAYRCQVSPMEIVVDEELEVRL